MPCNPPFCPADGETDAYILSTKPSIHMKIMVYGSFLDGRWQAPFNMLLDYPKETFGKCDRCSSNVMDVIHYLEIHQTP